MKKIKVILLLFLISILFLGCTGSRTKYKELSACNVELFINETSSMSSELHRIYKITVPAKTSINLRSMFLRGSDLNSETKIEPVFSENEFVLSGSAMTIQLISITGNNEINKKVVLVKGEDSYGITEEERIKYKKFIEKYSVKEKEIQKTGKINKNDIFIETNKNAEYINYPYLGTSTGINFYLTNDTNVPQEVYYNIFTKDTTFEIGKNVILYFIEGIFGANSNLNKNEATKEKKINYSELFKVVSTALKEDKTEYKIKEMERYYAEEYIKNKIKEIIENNFGELSNGQDKMVNYLTVTAIDIYFNKDSDFFIN